ncbi:MAG: sulfatase-like hydrolase/transferase [Candidatus Levybacteria bacterium]|nr:sulfatase-like hydrolase/transferase [Candidatus Levybacteria bacterium]
MSKRNPDLSKKTPTLTTIMKENGYQTAAFITNPALGMVAKTYFEKGFDTFSYSNISSPNVYSQYIFAYEYQNGAQATDKATNWIQENSEKPFFLWLHYNDSHMPYNPPKKYLCKLDPDCQNETKYQSLLKDRSASMPDAMPSCKRSVSPETIQKAEMLYDAEVLATDDLIKQVLSQLENQDLLKKSIIVITADHGEGFDHDMYHHGDSVYRSSMHIPLIIFDGSAPIKHSFDTLMDNSDTLPTILDLLHISSKNTFDGKSVAPLLKGKPFTKKPYVFMRTPPNESNRFAITNGKEKYTLYPRAECLWNNAQEELFVASDLYEEKNLSGNMSKSAKSLKETLLKQIKSQENQPKTPDDNKTLEKLRSIGY